MGSLNRNIEQITWFDRFWIGCFQVLALLTGVSRSGATIAGGMLRNLNRPAAARFSFLMSVPVMLGAGILALKDLAAMPGLAQFLLPLAVGFISALVSGYLAIRWLISYLGRHSLYVFAGYCLLAGLYILVLA
jgi:undecaprenyl-diphosphatase